MNRFPLNNVRPRAFFAVMAVACAALSGCSAPKETVVAKADALTANDVLDRCADAYMTAGTLRAEGRFDDFRPGGARDVPILWDYRRPGQTRLRMGDRVVIVRDGAWWRFDPAGSGFRSLPGLGGEPMDTAGYFVSEGVGLFAVALPERGREALEMGEPVGDAWRMDGARWIGQRPCYVLSRPVDPARPSLVRTIWVDQDRYELRGWAMAMALPGAEAQPIVRCEFDSVEFNANVGDRHFAVNPAPAPAIAAAQPRHR